MVESPSQQVRSGVIIKNGEKGKARQEQQRFHHITVHEHLYLDGIKQQKKRTIERIL